MVTEKRKISNEKDVEFQKWTLPVMGDESNKVIHREKEAPAKNTAQINTEEISSPDIPTAKDIETWHKEAHEEGYQQGMKQAEAEIAAQKKQLETIINFFEHPLQYLNEEVEQQLNLLAITLAQQLVRREIKTEPGEIIALIKESVKMLPVNSRKIRIYLHPADAAIVRKTLQLDEEQSWKLVEDPMITRGGCEIKSEQSAINVTLENRLQALAASVLGGDRVEDQSESSDEPSTD